MRFTMRERLQEMTHEQGGLEWEETACPLCQARSWDVIAEGPDHAQGPGGLWFAVVKCRECRMCFTNPRPSPASIGQFYGGDYESHREHTRRGHGLRARLRDWWQARGERQVLPARPGRLLDVGCGRGEFLARMQRLGWAVTGLDVVEDVVQRVRDELNVPVFAGTLPHPDLEPGSFDVVTMWHVLEHLHEPLPALREARRLLVRGGRLVLAVPCLDSLSFRWFGPHWYGLDLPRHLSHFSSVTLTAMLKLAGFHVHEVRPQWYSHWLRASARRAEQARPGPAWQRLLQNRKISKLATCYAACTRQADCLLATAIA